MSAISNGTSESSFWSRAFDEAIRPRGSHNETQHQQSHEKPSDSTRWYVAHTRKWKQHGKPQSFLLSTVLVFCFPCVKVSFVVFLHYLSFLNLGTRILLRERVVTPHIIETWIKLLKLQLSIKKRTNQITKVWNQIQRKRLKSSNCWKNGPDGAF
jgi:hypothetical protein